MLHPWLWSRSNPPMPWCKAINNNYTDSTVTTMTKLLYSLQRQKMKDGERGGREGWERGGGKRREGRERGDRGERREERDPAPIGVNNIGGLISHSGNAMWHGDVIKWKHFPRYWPFVRGLHQPPVNYPHKCQWHGPLMFSLICTLNIRLSEQSWGWWFKTPSRSLWRHCNWFVCSG